jgi:hypothetical protein
LKSSIRVALLSCLLIQPVMAKSLFLDPGEYFRRLESVGLSTTKLRTIAKKVFLEKFVWDSKTAAAQYYFQINKLKVPGDFCQPGTSKIKFDLDNTQLGTFTHEWCHAEDDFADDLLKSCNALDDADGLAKEDAIAALQTDVAAQEKATAAGRDPKKVPATPVTVQDHSSCAAEAARRLKLKSSINLHYKTWEIVGYFVDGGINNIFFNTNAIISYNKNQLQSYMRTAKDINTYKDSAELVMPPYLRNTKLVEAKGQTPAYFKAHTLGGTQEQLKYYLDGRDAIFNQIWDKVLGLHPPHDVQALRQNLNSATNTWIQGVRAQLKQARAEYARSHPNGTGESSQVLGALNDPSNLLGGGSDSR